MILSIILFLICIIIIAPIVGSIILADQFNKQVSELFTLSKNNSAKVFSYQQLSNLPEPVQRYFKHVLTNGQPYISYIRLTHDGQFKSGLKKDWADIKGEQYYTTENPGFIWKGKTSLFTARDMYIAGKGRLIVSLFSLLSIVNAQGEKYNQGELLRWLGESVWFPTNLLPDENLQWTPIDSLSAKLIFNYKGLSLFYIVRFNVSGEIIQMETKRYMDEENLETWIIKLSDYKAINGIVIPTKAEVMWRLKAGDFSYAKFNVKRIEYDKPNRFLNNYGIKNIAKYSYWPFLD